MMYCCSCCGCCCCCIVPCQVNDLVFFFFPKGSLLNSKIDQGKGILVMSGDGNSGSGNSGGGNIGGGMNAQWDALSKWADAIAALNEV